ncbi:hypothetical protein KC726_04420 [Candidatus Woesebacteria bacterium]|nr:hypothetical protein [Candidatus Woesebacteria bacterium]
MENRIRRLSKLACLAFLTFGHAYDLAPLPVNGTMPCDQNGQPMQPQDVRNGEVCTGYAANDPNNPGAIRLNCAQLNKYMADPGEWVTIVTADGRVKKVPASYFTIDEEEVGSSTDMLPIFQEACNEGLSPGSGVETAANAPVAAPVQVVPLSPPADGQAGSQLSQPAGQPSGMASQEAPTTQQSDNEVTNTTEPTEGKRFPWGWVLGGGGGLLGLLDILRRKAQNDILASRNDAGSSGSNLLPQTQPRATTGNTPRGQRFHPQQGAVGSRSRTPGMGSTNGRRIGTTLQQRMRLSAARRRQEALGNNNNQNYFVNIAIGQDGKPFFQVVDSDRLGKIPEPERSIVSLFIPSDAYTQLTTGLKSQCVEGDDYSYFNIDAQQFLRVLNDRDRVGENINPDTVVVIPVTAQRLTQILQHQDQNLTVPIYDINTQAGNEFLQFERGNIQNMSGLTRT